MKPIYIAYYTKNTGYAVEVKNLEASLIKFELDYEIQGITNLGSWNKNTHYKPTFIKEMLVKHERPVVYLDADAVVCNYPTLLDTADFDIGVPVLDWSKYRSRKQITETMSGTLYFKPTPRVSALIDAWIHVCEVDGKTWDQRLLAKLLPEFTILPDEYCVIFDFMRVVQNPIIKHMQASRRLRNVINKGGAPKC